MVDELALVGHPFTSNDSLTYVLNSLGQEYNSLGSIIISRQICLIGELYLLLLNIESMINQHHITIKVDASVIMVTKLPFYSHYHPTKNYPSFNQARGNTYHGKGRGGCSTNCDQTYMLLLFIRYASNRVITHLSVIIVLISLTRINPNINNLKLSLLPNIHMQILSGILI